MRDLFPTKNFRCLRRNPAGEVENHWVKPSLDFSAKVVCKPCNEGWMSNLESQHAKPAMRDLIIGKCDMPITQSQARSIAVFAFKTAVVIDHLRREESFYSREIRHDFARSLRLPIAFQVWCAGYLPMGSGRVTSVYYEHPTNTGDGLKLHVCTFAVGHFAFQTVASKYFGPSISFSSKSGFDHLSVPLWPEIPSGFVWPAGDVLRSPGQFEAFAERWEVIEPPRY